MLARARRGFTLVEIAVVAVIVSVLFIVVYALFFGGQDSFRRGTGISDALVGAMNLADLVEGDCMQLTGLPDIRDGGHTVLLPQAGRKPVVWRLEPPAGRGRPGFVRRDGKVLRETFFRTLDFVRPSDGIEDARRFLVVRGEATDRRGDATYGFARVLALPPARTSTEASL